MSDLLCVACGAKLDSAEVCPKCKTSVTLLSFGYNICKAQRGLNFYKKNEVQFNFTWDKLKDRERVYAAAPEVPRELIERAIAKVLEPIEKPVENKEKTSNSAQTPQDQPRPEIPVSVRRGAMDLLRDPFFFYKLGWVFEWGFFIKKINRVRFVTKEERMKRIVPLLIGGAAIRGLTSILRLIGPPGTGKDAELRLSTSLLEGGLTWVERGFLTGGGLRYSDAIKEAQVLYIPDSPEFSGEMGHQLRLMRSDDGGIMTEYAYKDKETNQMTTKVETLPIKVIITSSNEIRMDPALESGAWTLEANDTPELTEHVQRQKLMLRAGRRLIFPEDELAIWRAACRIVLTEELPGPIHIPYADNLMFILSSSSTSQRRAPDKLCDLIETVAFWRRFQKPNDLRDKADWIDLYIALQLGLDVLLKTISPLDAKDMVILEEIKRMNDDASVKVIAIGLKMANNTAYQKLENLVDRGYLAKDKEKGRNIYSRILREINSENILFSLNKTDNGVFKLLEKFCESVGNSSDSSTPTEVSQTIDPLTGNEVEVGPHGFKTIEIAADNNPEKLLFPYGFPKNWKSPQQGTETVSDGEKEVENLLIKENKMLLASNEERAEDKHPLVPLVEEDEGGDLISALLRDVKGNEEVGELYLRDWLEIHGIPRTEAENVIVGLRDAGKLTRTEGGWKA